jgi:hypothetical protein
MKDSCLTAVDTSKKESLVDPLGKLDQSVVRSGSSARHWVKLVVPAEFKRDINDHNKRTTGIGQVTDRIMIIFVSNQGGLSVVAEYLIPSIREEQ